MRKFLNVFLIASLSMIIALSAAGCKPHLNYIQPGDNYDVSLEVDNQIAATLKVGLYTRTEQDTKHWSEIEKGFKLIFPNVNIVLQDFTGNYYQELSKAYSSETMPDLLMVNSVISFVGIEKGLLLNLNPYIQAEKSVNSKYEEQFIESMWKLGQENYDGSQYFVPRSADRVVVHYNKTQLINAGVNMNTVKNGWTWDDFMAACAKVHTWYRDNKAGKKFINGFWSWEANLFPMLESFGGKVFDGSDIVLDSPQTRAYLTALSDLVNVGYTTENSPSAEDFKAKNAAFCFHSQSVDFFLDDLGSEYDVVTFPLIGDTAKAKIGSGIAGYGIFSGIEENKRNLAWQLLNFMLSKEGQNIMARSGITVPPIRVDMQTGENEWRQGKESLNMEAYIWETDRNFATDFYLGQNPEKQIELINALENMTKDVMMRPNPKTPERAIADCIQELRNILQRA